MHLNSFQKPLQKILLVSIVIVVVVAGIVAMLLKQEGANGSPATTNEGKLLTEKYCQSCHLLPGPELLDKANWKKLLPEMGFRLGIRSPEVKAPQEDLSFYPEHAALNLVEWQKILNYYQSAAPASLPAQNKPVVANEAVPFFGALLPPENIFTSNTVVTCVKLDQSVQPARLFIYDATAKKLLLFSQRGLVDAIYTDDVIVDLKFYKNNIYACSIGKELIIGTVNNKFGKVFPITINNGKMQVQPALIKGLARPVEVVPTDLDNDNRTDFIVCEFGGLRGALSWFRNTGNNTFQQKMLRNESGSVNVIVKQNPLTGLNDLWVLFAQGEEGIFHFANKGNATFNVKEVIRFPPTYGSTSFTMADINNDGKEDIIYTCGDNGDVTDVLKPYHGIYVYTNMGDNNFQQQFFYPMHGCYKVVANNFTGSSHIDLAAIAYFTDLTHPEAFVFLKNNGNTTFSAYKPPAEINFESILTMDSGDFNGDGKPDIFLGNALTDTTLKGSPFAILANLRQ